MTAGVKIGLWGGTSSGKTTYLAALRIATLLNPAGGWSIEGADDLRENSTMFLSRMTNALRQHRFPPATIDTVHQYAFRITGNVPRALGMKRVSFTLFFDDRPGGHYFRKTNPKDELWTELASCDGLIFLFDPKRELRKDAGLLETDARFDEDDEELDEEELLDNLAYIQHVADFVKQTAGANGWLHKQLLPHYLAVCITKFDDARVFNRLLGNPHGDPPEENLVEPHDPEDAEEFSESPFVPDARAAFDRLADPETVAMLERFFHDDRIAYFVISSIGFYGARIGHIKRTNFTNVTGSRPERIRGEVTPINVFEPLKWIYDRASRGEGKIKIR